MTRIILHFSMLYWRSTKYIKPDDKVSLICDDDKATAMNCYRLYCRVRLLLPELKKKLVAITFADDDILVALQAADLFASLCRLEAGLGFHREYYEFVPSFHALTDDRPGMSWGVKFYDEPELLLTAKSHLLECHIETSSG